MERPSELSPEQQEAASKIEKLLRLAGRNTSEAEASSAMAKAQDLMRAFNLDQAAIEENSGDVAKRSDEKLKGGHYEFHRDLWRDVAKLNFCLYFSITEIEKKYAMRPKDPSQPHLGFKKVVTKETRVRSHRIVGRTVNTRSTRAMAEYLEEAVERILMPALITRFGEADAQAKLYSQWANSFREGVIERVCEKLYDRYREYMRDESRKQQEAAQAARAKGMEGVSTSTAVTLASYIDAEKAANEELINPGITARRARWASEDAAERVRRAEASAAAEAAYTAWAAANPIEAALAEARRKKEQDQARKREERNAARRTGRTYREAPYKGDWSARKAGYAAGEDVSIDRQADDGRSRKMLG